MLFRGRQTYYARINASTTYIFVNHIITIELIKQEYEVNECLYQVACGYFALGKLKDARYTTTYLLSKDPGNVRANQLYNSIIQATDDSIYIFL